MADTPWKYGYVALLDCLGVRSLDYAGVERFLETSGEDERYAEGQGTTAVELCPDEIARRHKPETISFADNLAVTWEVSRFSIDSLGWFASILNTVIWSGLKHGNRWRGALTFGSYIIRPEGRGVLGTAVSEAANDFERVPWIGVIATESLGLRADAGLLEAQPPRPDALENALVRYKRVPFSTGPGTRWCTAWPYMFQRGDKDPWNPAEAEVLNCLAAPLFPEKDAPKRDNTIAFFRWFRRREEKHRLREAIERNAGTVTDDPGGLDV